MEDICNKIGSVIAIDGVRFIQGAISAVEFGLTMSVSPIAISRGAKVAAAFREASQNLLVHPNLLLLEVKESFLDFRKVSLLPPGWVEGREVRVLLLLFKSFLFFTSFFNFR